MSAEAILIALWAIGSLLTCYDNYGWHRDVGTSRLCWCGWCLLIFIAWTIPPMFTTVPALYRAARDFPKWIMAPLGSRQ